MTVDEELIKKLLYRASKGDTLAKEAAEAIDGYRSSLNILAEAYDKKIPNPTVIKTALDGAKQTVDFIYTQGHWPKGAFRQYENLIHSIQAALRELEKDGTQTG